ncbi:conserved hypothetical protein, partial [Ixodes scapularis]
RGGQRDERETKGEKKKRNREKRGSQNTRALEEKKKRNREKRREPKTHGALVRCRDSKSSSLNGETRNKIGSGNDDESADEGRMGKKKEGESEQKR